MDLNNSRVYNSKDCLDLTLSLEQKLNAVMAEWLDEHLDSQVDGAPFVSAVTINLARVIRVISDIFGKKMDQVECVSMIATHVVAILRTFPGMDDVQIDEKLLEVLRQMNSGNRDAQFAGTA